MTRRAFLLTVGFEYTAARRVLNETLFVSLPQTRAVLDAWRGDYNRVINRVALGADDQQRATETLLGVKGKRLTYKAADRSRS